MGGNARITQTFSALGAFASIVVVGMFWYVLVREPAPAFVAPRSALAAAVFPLAPTKVAAALAPVAALAPIASVPTTTSAQGEAHILFVGDMFFDRHIREVAAAQGGDYLFSCIDPLLQSADFVVGNLEGPITDNASVSVGSVVGSANNYRFTFASSTAPLLAAHHLRAVSLGNNHIENFGIEGLLQTQEYLHNAGVGYFGGVSGNEPVYRTEDRGVPLSFVGYNQFGGGSAASVAFKILSEREAGRTVIVFAHWGTEYSTTTDETRPIATLFAESGASAIIGSHPHIVGVHEYLGDTLVYYSLGNFIFDQYFNSAVTHGLALMLTIPPSGRVVAEEYPTVISRDGRTCQTLVGK